MAVLGAMPALAVQATLLELHVQAFLESLGEERVIDVAGFQPQQFVAAITQTATGGRVCLENVSVGVVQEDGVVDGLEQDPHPVPRLAAQARQTGSTGSRLHDLAPLRTSTSRHFDCTGFSTGLHGGKFDFELLCTRLFLSCRICRKIKSPRLRCQEKSGFGVSPGGAFSVD